MVLDDMVARVREIHGQRAERLRAITTRNAALAYRDEVRGKIASLFAPLPEAGPLNARVTGSVAGPGFTVENVVFESVPGCLVTANLYLPAGRSRPAPGALVACGHSAPGKASDYIQSTAQRLVNAGLVALAYDPLNQGERDQYEGVPGAAETASSATSAHNMMAKSLELVGCDLPSWFVWDARRALDYLLSRPEVDARHVGMTGCSGGGTMTTWLWGLEPRLTMAAPSCFVTSFLRNLENEIPADAEQYPVGALAAGLEEADWLIARAPQPLLLLGQRYCFFDRRGLQEAYAEVQQIYGLLGAPEGTAEYYEGPYPHGITASDEEVLVRFFARHAGLPMPQPGVPITPLPPEALNATPTGSVVAAGSRPVHAWVAARAQQLAAERPVLRGDALAERLRALLALPATVPVPEYRNLRPRYVAGRACGRYAVETERNVRAILHKRLAHAERAHALEVERVVHLTLPHCSAEDEWLAEVTATDTDLGDRYALDVRGLGETVPDDALPFWHPYNTDYMLHGHGLMLGMPYIGRRVLDVLATVALLGAEGAREVHLAGTGQGALLALFAALLDERITRATLRHAPASFGEWAAVPIVQWPAANVVPGVLRYLDIPDCLRALGDRVQVCEPWDPGMHLAQS